MTQGLIAVLILAGVAMFIAFMTIWLVLDKKFKRPTKRIYGLTHLPGDSGAKGPVGAFRDIPIDDPIPDGWSLEDPFSRRKK